MNISSSRYSRHFSSSLSCNVDVPGDTPSNTEETTTSHGESKSIPPTKLAPQKPAKPGKFGIVKQSKSSNNQGAVTTPSVVGRSAKAKNRQHPTPKADVAEIHQKIVRAVEDYMIPAGTDYCATNLEQYLQGKLALAIGTTELAEYFDKTNPSSRCNLLHCFIDKPSPLPDHDKSR